MVLWYLLRIRPDCDDVPLWACRHMAVLHHRQRVCASACACIATTGLYGAVIFDSDIAQAVPERKICEILGWNIVASFSPFTSQGVDDVTLLLELWLRFKIFVPAAPVNVTRDMCLVLEIFVDHSLLEFASRPCPCVYFCLPLSSVFVTVFVLVRNPRLRVLSCQLSGKARDSKYRW